MKKFNIQPLIFIAVLLFCGVSKAGDLYYSPMAESLKTDLNTGNYEPNQNLHFQGLEYINKNKNSLKVSTFKDRYSVQNLEVAVSKYFSIFSSMDIGLGYSVGFNRDGNYRDPVIIFKHSTSAISPRLVIKGDEMRVEFFIKIN